MFENYLRTATQFCQYTIIQNFVKSPPYFRPMLCQSKVRWRLRKILWPSQNIWTLTKIASREDRTLDPWFTRPVLYHWAIEAPDMQDLFTFVRFIIFEYSWIFELITWNCQLRMKMCKQLTMISSSRSTKVTLD